MNELPQERLLVANMAIASAEACFEWTRAYVKDRKVSWIVCLSMLFVASFCPVQASLPMGRKL